MLFDRINTNPLLIDGSYKKCVPVEPAAPAVLTAVDNFFVKKQAEIVQLKVVYFRSSTRPLSAYPVDSNSSETVLNHAKRLHQSNPSVGPLLFMKPAEGCEKVYHIPMNGGGQREITQLAANTPTMGEVFLI